MNLLPVKFEKWFLEKTYNFVVGRASKVFGRGSSSTSNGTWALGAVQENKLAYEAVTKDVWFYSSIYAIASSASGLLCGGFKRTTPSKGGDYQIEEDSQLSKLFYRPNLIQTRSEFIEAIFWSLELTGKVFIEVVGTKANPTELYVLDPRLMKPIPNKDKFISGYEFDLNGKKIPFAPEDIIFHRYHNPSDPYNGLSASTAAGDSINSDILSNQFNNEYYGNSAIPAAVLEVERRMNDDECNLLRLQWEKGHKGRGKRHRTAILFGGVKFSVIQKSPKEMEFVKQKVINREEILASYGVPPVLVGLLEKVNYANSKEQRKLFWQQTMRPKLRSLAERFTLEFGLDGVKKKFMFDLTEVEALQEDQEIKSRIAFNITKSLIMTPDEVRRIFYKLPPMADGVGDTIWVPTNMVPAKLQLKGPVAAKPAAGNDGAGNPSGPDAQPKPNNQKPDAAGTDNKPAGKPAKHLVTTDDFLEKQEEEIRKYMEEYRLEETILVG